MLWLLLMPRRFTSRAATRVAPTECLTFRLDFPIISTMKIVIMLLLCALIAPMQASQIQAVCRTGNAALVVASKPESRAQPREIWTLSPWKRRCIVRGNSARWSEDSAAFSRDGRFLALGCIDSTIEIYDARSGVLRVRLGRVQPETRRDSALADAYSVDALAFSPDGKTLASGNGKGAFFWNWRAKKLLFSRPLWERGEIEGRVLEPRRAYPSVMEFSPDGKSLAIGGGFSSVFLFDVARKKVRRVLPLHSSDGGASALQFSPDGGRLLVVGIWMASGANFDQIALFNARSGRALWRWSNESKNPINARGYERAAFASDGTRFAVSSHKRLEIRSARSARLLWARDFARDLSSLETQRKLLPELNLR